MQRELGVRAGKAVGLGLSTTFTPMSDWITDRLPTEADADRDGEVAVKQRPASASHPYFHWSSVKPGMAWRRTDYWVAPEPAVPATQPRRFVSISRTVQPAGHTLDAIADDGTAWWKVLGSDDQTDWHQLSPLPAREFPTEPAF